MLNANYPRQDSTEFTYAKTVKTRIPTKIEHSNTKYYPLSQGSAQNNLSNGETGTWWDDNSQVKGFTKDTIHNKTEFLFDAPKKPMMDLEQIN